MNAHIPIFTLIIGLAWPCASHAQTGSGMDFFESKIRPVLVDRCYECHSKQSGKTKGGLRVDSRDALLKGGENGPSIIAGAPDKSLLIKALSYTDPDMEMPPKGKLPDAVIEDFRKWIAMGAPDPRTTSPVTTTTKTTIDINKGRSFWSYQQLTKPKPPVPNDAAWPRTDVDRFIKSALEANSLAPVRDASAATLVRRLFFVLTGLPPPPEALERWTVEISANADDGSALNQDAIAGLVNALLGTTHYGEHWGRHWLDVSRFAESTGGDRNSVYQHAWRYRDYVIDSFNSDKPFDRFIREQIAGDLMPAANDKARADAMIATGFLAIGVKNVGEEDGEKFAADLVDEQIDSTTRAFLATSAACARCHDHKFDPIPQTDYYALAGIFRGTDTRYGLIKAQSRHTTPLLDLTGMGPPPAMGQASKQKLDELAKARDDTAQAVEDAMKAIRAGENVFRGILRKIRSDREEAAAAFQAFSKSGEAKVFAMGALDLKDVPVTRLLVRGELDKPAQVVRPGALQALTRTGQSFSSVQGSGRLQLANWIATPQNPLTARVMANRVWAWMFGQGLVRTVDDFGKTGEAPSHPELLDYLATRLIEHKWSVKALIREIALSRAWQLSSEHGDAQFSIDPNNRLHWRMNKRRLDAESVRDAVLSASGALDRSRPLGTFLSEVGEGNVGMNVFEPEIRAIETNHRSVYLPRVRNVIPEILELFDAPDADAVCGMRDTTASPLQALFMMNNPFVMKQAELLAKRIDARPEAEQIDLTYKITLGREPTDAERQHTAAFMQQFSVTALRDIKHQLSAFCQALLCTTEFTTID
jgi:cytochrome c553